MRLHPLHMQYSRTSVARLADCHQPMALIGQIFGSLSQFLFIPINEEVAPEHRAVHIPNRLGSHIREHLLQHFQLNHHARSESTVHDYVAILPCDRLYGRFADRAVFREPNVRIADDPTITLKVFFLSFFPSTETLRSWRNAFSVTLTPK